MLRDLPLTRGEQRALRRAERRAAELSAAPWGQVAHLPFLLLTATR
jgi:hypothetical protein